MIPPEGGSLEVWNDKEKHSSLGVLARPPRRRTAACRSPYGGSGAFKRITARFSSINVAVFFS